MPSPTTSRAHVAIGTTVAVAGLALTVIAQQTDPLLPDQWHLKERTTEVAGANVLAEWFNTKGEDVVIGIVDDGVQWAHPDLSPNYVPSLSWDFADNDADPAPAATDPFGTAAAGVAAARDGNGIGGAGVAPRASIAGLRLTEATRTDAIEAAALRFSLNDIDILANSWGPADDGATLSRPGPLAESALLAAASNGRQGLGRVTLWNAGNGRELGDNCNFDGYANHRYVLAVGTVSDNAQQPWYGEPCSALFVVAPSDGGARGITTTDLVGSDGIGPTDYTSTFGNTLGKTSAAVPQVAGAVALMLARNPALTRLDVMHILRESSIRINPSDASWTTGPYPHSEKYGFGLLDATAAANLAATWHTRPRQNVTSSMLSSTISDIPDNNSTGVTRSFAMPASTLGTVRIQHVEVNVSATHARRGDLHVTLTSPSGVVSTMSPGRSSDTGANFDQWSFMSVRHWDESPTGTWTVRVSDRRASITGQLTRVLLRFYAYYSGPATSTTDPTNVTRTTATLHGTVNPGGSETTAAFLVGLTQAFGLSFPVTPAPGAGYSDVTVTGMATGLVCGTFYVVRLQAENALGIGPFNNRGFTTLACPAPFTDEPLVPGVTPIRAVHVLELRNRVNAARLRCGLEAISWTDGALDAVLVRAVHIQQLRDGLAAAFLACGRPEPMFSDPSLVPLATFVRAIHLTELRRAVEQLE